MTRRLVVDIYERDGTTHVATLTSDRDREYLDDLFPADGSFSFEIHADHADAGYATPDRVARFSIDGTARWQGDIDDVAPVKADPSRRKAGHVSRVSGRSTMCRLELAGVYPELGLGLISPTQRYMTPASVDYDISGWSAAVELKAVTSTSTPWAIDGVAAPQPWPTELAGAYWIGDTDYDTPDIPAGKWRVAKDVTIPTDEGGEHRLYITADDGYRVFIDGDVVAEETKAFLWGVTRYVDVMVDEGDHRVMVEVTNIDRPGTTNVTGVVFGMAALNPGGQTLGDVRFVSDDSWKINTDATPPGMTPGKILDVLLTEAQSLYDFLDGLTWDFDGDVDSDGTSWPEEIDVNFAVNTSLMDVARHLYDEHACEFAMSATGLVLHAYVPGGRGADRTATVNMLVGTNLSRLGARRTRPGGNTGLTRTAEGRWVEYEETGASATYGKRWVGLSLGSAPSDDAAVRQVSAFFADTAYGTDALTDAQLEVLDADTDYATGDYVTATAATSGTADHRVHAIRVATDAAGQPIYQPQLVRESP